MEEKRNIEMGVRIKDNEENELSSAMKFSLYLTYFSYLLSVFFILIGMFGSKTDSMMGGTILFILSSISLMSILKIDEKKKKK